ncbi:energy transducer TonB [Devosia sp.]|uniref:energy transducer TonB n=1 Tax=Devosia sp. TaxID=1871048 RepID=UPI001AC7D7B3|nr:energy transducer TonB [Devosia sp.]MBN9332720.1 energy transducer TonB [Devosia sp.]
MKDVSDSFVAEDFLRASKGDVALWAAASLIVVLGLSGGYLAYQTFAPVEEMSGPPAGAMTIEFAEFAVSPTTEELDIPDGELSSSSEDVPPSEAEPDPEAELIGESEPVEETPPEVEPEPAPEPEKVVETAEAEIEQVREPEPVAQPEPEPAPLPEPIVEPAEPIIEAPEVEAPEPAVVVPQQALPREPEPEVVEEPPAPEPLPEEPVVEPLDPTLPVPIAMPQRIADIRANTEPTKFTPPPRRTPPPQQTASLASAPKPQAQQAAQAAAPQQSTSSEPSTSQVNRWESSVLRHLGQRRKFPPEARQRGEKGRVVVQFAIDVGGNVQSVSIARSSGFASLDQAALDLVRASSPVPRPPEGLPRSRLTISMPIDYER